MTDFDIKDFTPYLLNLAAEASGVEFQRQYKNRYGMLRNEWRVLFHLGRYGDMHAKGICDLARLHKTKVSRAVAALEAKRFLKRRQVVEDRRHALLFLTPAGQAAYGDLVQAAHAFDDALGASFTDEERRILRKCLSEIARVSS